MYEPLPSDTELARLARTPLCLLPRSLLRRYLAYQFRHQRRFLLLINVLGQLAFLSYWLADAYAIPDMARESLFTRSALVLLAFAASQAALRWCRDMRVLDLVLPLSILMVVPFWYGLLARSASPAVQSYQYAALIFIVLANLCVRVRFLPALLVSLLISAVILDGSRRLSHGQHEPQIVFLLVYLPVLLFSLFISWSNTVAGRRTFLRHHMARHASHALTRANAQLSALVRTDALTGIANRRYLDEQAHRYWDEYRQHGQGFGLLMVDIDYFKAFNDHCGHPAGDACLTQVARLLESELRKAECLVGRYGGEEFAVLVGSNDPGDLSRIAQRLVQAVRAHGIRHAHRPDGLGVVTISVGGLVCTATGVGSLQSLQSQADALLYQAKRSGRNRACLEP